MNIIVSACLLGVNCRYDGCNNEVEKIKLLRNKYNLIPVCPEQLGGLATPRAPSEIVREADKSPEKVVKRVKSINGLDVTECFKKGAEEAMKITKYFRCPIAILKANSPSCGYEKVYDGTFTKKLTEGNGVFVEELVKNGIEIYTEKDLEKLILL